MNNPQQNLPKYLLVFGFIFVAGLIGYFVFNNIGFRITGTSVQDTLPTSTNQFYFDFSEELASADDQPESFVQLNPERKFTASIDGSRLYITLQDSINDTKALTVKFQNISAAAGDTLSTSRKFNVSYVQFSDLAEEEQARQTQESSVPEDTNPLLSKLPYDEIAFRITYFIDETKYNPANDWRAEKDNYAVYIYTYAIKQGVDAATYKSKNLDLREKAKDWIRKQGVDPDTDITIVFNPSDAELDGGQNQAGD